MGDKKTTKTGPIEALLHGWLKEVNWDKRTAQLHRLGSESVRLHFQPSLDDEIARLATRYVEVSGRGHLNKQDRWVSVEVEQVEATVHVGSHSIWKRSSTIPTQRFSTLRQW